MKKKQVITAALLVTSLSACQIDNQTLGGAAGAAAGAGIANAAGGGTFAIIAGALAGAWLGSEVAKSLTDADRAAMQHTTQNSLERAPAGATSSWQNPDSGNSGTITPQQRFTNSQGAECREFQQSVTANGQTETGYATACQQADGSWKVVG